MNFKKYRFTLLCITTAIVWASIFTMYGDISLLWANIWRAMKDISIVESATLKDIPTIVPIVVPIQDIISERYLYTLTKYIEADLMRRSGTGVNIESSYGTYNQVSLSGSDFVVTVGAVPIEIPESMYFFDTWNSVTKNTVSWEVYSNTVLHHTWSHSKFIALTFDDGPSAKYTNTLLDILKKEDVKATFYVLWSRAEEYPNILKREYAEWHEIGNHSYSHAFLARISEKMMQEELYKTDQAIYRAIGIYPTTFRPPYGEVSTGMLERSAMPAILWSIDTRDWKTRNITRNIKAVTNARDGDIIILHDIHETSIESVPGIIKNLKERGFTFVTISELLSLTEKNTEIWKKCTKKGSCK